MNLTEKIIAAHLADGVMKAGEPIALRIDQTLTQDTTGTMTYLQFEAIGVPRVKTRLSVSYVDHNTLQTGFRNPDDHRFLRTIAAKYGLVFSPPGTGICHQLHLENFAKPGVTLLGADSHTPTAGGVGALAIGAGGLSVALAMAGEPFGLNMPKVVGVRLVGRLQGWATAKDVILHILSRLSVKGGVGKVLEYAGPGVATLSVPERGTITNMGAELGATTSIFPSDDKTREFLRLMGREADWQALVADPDCAYDEEMEVDLSALEPLAACPHMPDLVKPVAELAGLKVDQVGIGSCTNSSYSDLSLVAQVFKGRHTAVGTDVLISPGSKQVLTMLAQSGELLDLYASGARVLECACGPCIGMGGSPVSGGVSVRTFNRNFEGRSGTQDAKVYLVSPLVAAKAALDGQFSDPAGWGEAPKDKGFPAQIPSIRNLFIFPEVDGSKVEVLRGPNIVALKPFAPLPEDLRAEVVIRTGDNITTDHIVPGGAEVSALRSNIPAISRYVFSRLDKDFADRATSAGAGVIVGGENYGQGSSREHAALGPLHLGVRLVIVKSFARIHRTNLINIGILPLLFADEAGYEQLEQGVKVELDTRALVPGGGVTLKVDGKAEVILKNDLSAAELDIVRAGGLLNYTKNK